LIDEPLLMIEVENLVKKYGNFEAVRGVSFTVNRAEVLGFLGPNGAGKTTIMKMLTGYHFPSGGRVMIDGISVEEDPVEIKKRIGYLPENVPLYGDMSPREYLNFTASARMLSKAERCLAVESAIKTCGLEGYETRRIENLSKGYRQRVGLAQAIIHDPAILILDEPSSGLDPNQIIEIRALIRELGKRKTLILSPHILQEVEAVCTRVLILNEGRIAAQGTPEEIAGGLRSSTGGDNWELRLHGARAAGLETSLSRLGLPPPSCVSDVSVDALDNGTIRLCFVIRGCADGAENGELIFDWAVNQGYKITGMKMKKLSLEDIFVKLTAEVQPLTNERVG
jgi:ABC-2 type transport system ATP-binding protein